VSEGALNHWLFPVRHPKQTAKADLADYFELSSIPGPWGRRGQKYFLKPGPQTLQAKVISFDSRINIQIYEPELHSANLAMNGIGEVRLRTAKLLVFDGYTTNASAAAGMLRSPEKVCQPEYDDFMV
jgi:sulfate adenylyltransferase subunit 1 (EFTu-like GTPase family)